MTPNNPENQTKNDETRTELEQRLAEAAAEIRRLSALVDELLEERDNHRRAVGQPSSSASEGRYQDRVQEWCVACFGPTVATDVIERNHRFLEEALELVQALGCAQDEAHQLVDYVFSRPKGEPAQELGGVMVTVAALAVPNGLDMESAAETELARVWAKVEKIRAKHAAKPQFGPLPGPSETIAAQPPMPERETSARPVNTETQP